MGRAKRIRPKRLGEKLGKIRGELTREELILRLAYNDTKLYPQNIWDFEKSNKEPNLLVLLAYARLAGVSADVLIDDELDLP